jgi:RNA polymerase sigma factor (sigma-70 family)
MAIDPIAIHLGVLNQNPEAETELMNFLRNLVWQDYRNTLGPLAEDFLQDLSVRVIQAIREGKIHDPAKLIPYCQKLASHVRIDGLRIVMRQARKLVAIDEARSQHSNQDTEGQLIAAQELDQQTRTVLKLMERLDPFSFEVIRRYYFERQSPARIEEELEMSHIDFQRAKDRAVEQLRRDYRRLADARGWMLLDGGKGRSEEDTLVTVFVAAA